VLIARSVERIADNAVDIAEQAAFIVTAERSRIHRRVHPETSQALARPLSHRFGSDGGRRWGPIPAAHKSDAMTLNGRKFDRGAPAGPVLTIQRNSATSPARQ